MGRAKSRAYAYMTTPAESRSRPRPSGGLKVAAVAGQLRAPASSLASDDLDIRGARHPAGREEQSGHIREIGVELYPADAEDAVNEPKTRAGQEGLENDRGWSPQINTGAAVLIHLGVSMSPDLNARSSLSRSASV